MFPLIKAYCRDIQKLYERVDVLVHRYHFFKQLVTQNGARREKIERIQAKLKMQLELYSARFKRWRLELEELQIKVCSAEHGRVDVPAYEPSMENVIWLCIDKNTTIENMEWHLTDEGCEKARPYLMRDLAV